MNLDELKREYRVIYSIGYNCLPALQLRRAGLRRRAGPFDWMISFSWDDVTSLIVNHFEGFMERPNLQTIGHDGTSYSINPDGDLLLTGTHAEHGNFLVKDCRSGIISAHDFSCALNTEHGLEDYPQVYEKLHRRVHRFHESLSESVLFVRVNGKPDEAERFVTAMESHLRCPFAVLVVNHADTPELVEKDWGLPHVCAVDIPAIEDIWFSNDKWWDIALQGISSGQG